MPTSTQLKEQIDLALNNSVADLSIAPAIEATQIKSVVDYADQQDALKENVSNKSQSISEDTGSENKYPSVKAVEDYNLKESQILNLTATPTELTKYVNYANGADGICFLGVGKPIGTKYLLFANADCVVRAVEAGNVANMYVTYGTAIASVSVSAFESYSFENIGSNVWKATQM